MNKHLLTTLLLLLHLHSQSQQKHFTLSADAGATLPIGNHKSTDQQNSLAGYANPGWATSLSLSYRVSTVIDLVAMGHYQQNGINTNAFAEQLPNAQLFVVPWRYGNWQVQPQSWITKSALLGISTSLMKENSSNKLSIRMKLLAGAAFVKSPEFSATSKSDTAYALFFQSSNSATGVAFLAGPDLSYRINQLVSAKLSIDYYWTNQLSFKPVRAAVGATVGGLIVPNVYDLNNSRLPPMLTNAVYEAKQTINSMNVKLGVAFSL